MTKHLDWCVGGEKGPCNCGADVQGATIAIEIVYSKESTVLSGIFLAQTRAQLVAQKRNLCNVRAEFDRDIAKMQAHRAAVAAGIQALEAQIAALVDKKDGL